MAFLDFRDISNGLFQNRQPMRQSSQASDQSYALAKGDHRLAQHIIPGMRLILATRPHDQAATK